MSSFDRVLFLHTMSPLTNSIYAILAPACHRPTSTLSQPEHLHRARTRVELSPSREYTRKEVYKTLIELRRLHWFNDTMSAKMREVR